MEGRSRVSKAILAGTKLAEVAGGQGHDVVIQLENDPTSWPTPDSDIELRSEESAFVLAVGRFPIGNKTNIINASRICVAAFQRIYALEKAGEWDQLYSHIRWTLLGGVK